ncbi:cellobiohydrolase 1 [Cantharellus anzutake]|uniref:cellobiohydrolase 1 n=1 Tax=Cantharellus anzutake TaxID=1750568 RepID=UPI0019032CAC|nr:cellobiohydrolase 1 [Cantharellus anzutake]KAF8335802.1 cellobiohydrolase 1 [Cantharellus anzutake]
MIGQVALLSALLSIAHAQNAGTLTPENHPSLAWSQCSAGGSCTSVNGKITLDANWRWTHSTSSSTNCYTGNQWDKTLCPDPATCTTNCALDGADYSGTYGITTSGDSLKLNFVTNKNVGSRVYLLADDEKYQKFHPKNQEITFDVDVSKLPCGINGAVYFTEMDADGGTSKYPTNKAGAKYGTGYCDSQCPRDIKFIGGVANLLNWNATSANSGTGSFGACCTEMDLWEANSISSAYTPHPCNTNGFLKCSGDECGHPSRYSGLCDPDGCDFNSFRQGDTSFYGKGLTVDTSHPFTVVTQFITTDGTENGDLTEIKRFYVQNGRVIPNSQSKISGVSGNSITDPYCSAQKVAFGDTNSFSKHGGLKTVGESLARGHVLVLSLWDDYDADMHWLDSTYPTDADPTKPGVVRGTCTTTSGQPADVESSAASAYAVYSNIRFGPHNSTFSGSAGPSPAPNSTSSTTSTSTRPATRTSMTPGTSGIPKESGFKTSTTTSSAPSATQTKYGQCGGNGYKGPTTCVAGCTCTNFNPWYSQCL